jgi:hypothetical protein
MFSRLLAHSLCLGLWGDGTTLHTPYLKIKASGGHFHSENLVGRGTFRYYPSLFIVLWNIVD